MVHIRTTLRITLGRLQHNFERLGVADCAYGFNGPRNTLTRRSFKKRQTLRNVNFFQSNGHFLRKDMILREAP